MIDSCSSLPYSYSVPYERQFYVNGVRYENGVANVSVDLGPIALFSKAKFTTNCNKHETCEDERNFPYSFISV